MQPGVIEIIVEQADRIFLKGDTYSQAFIAEADFAGEGDFANNGARREGERWQGLGKGRELGW